MASYKLIQINYKYPTDKDIYSGLESGLTSTSISGTTTTVTPVDLISKILGDGKQVVRLGIQAEPGTKISINDVPILIGHTGLYELIDGIIVTSLKFISTTNPLGFKRILVDMIYEEGESS